MKDEKSDRTRIKSRAVGNRDVTRLAPAVQKATSRENKTRIAKDSSKQENATDATRYKPASVSSNVKTRIPPTADNNQSSALNGTTSHILKERFVLEEVLGAGGMGVVYKAKDLLKVEAQDRDPYVAIKVLSEEFKAHPEAFISLQRESRKSQRIAHPNIVNVYDFDRDGDTVFMTMEFLDGEALDELIARYSSTGLPTDDAWEIIQGMTSALIHAHAEKIIHSDFKPGNVFVTRKGFTKVFDFGIARAVAQVEHLEGMPEDQTLFDAGNLGALTPAYASLEMLEGKEPDVRDDIYALGCVAYEMLTGEHPYNKVPADEAERQGLKAKRISHIKKKQWRAIEQAIAFRREDRLGSAKEFANQIKPQRKTYNWLVSGLAILFAIGVSAYFLVFKEAPKVPEFSEFDIRNELELKIRIDFLKEDVELLLKDANFSDRWQQAIWKDISDLMVLTKGKDRWVDRQKQFIFLLYIERIEAGIKERKYTRAEKLLENAKRFNPDETRLTELAQLIKTGRKHEAARQKLLAKKAAENKKKSLAEQQARTRQVAKKKQLLAQQQAEQKARIEQFDVALDNLNTQLKCQSGLNMRNFETALKKLQQLNPRKYADLEPGIINTLAACIDQIGKSFPERARTALKHSLKLFDSNVLSNISIKSRDPCDASLAGLGARGKRATCKDKLKSGYGPQMVVIPGSSKFELFAMGKYEVSVGEYNAYCKISSKCKLLKQDRQMPVSGISLSQAKSYLQWLSEQSGKKYRLPRKVEWVHAVKSRSKSIDPNRNCALNTRGFEKGGSLVKFSIGKQNLWGLINYVGNVQEWVYASGRSLQAVGGSFREPMESCTITTSNSHGGNADSHTGFRVLREIEE